jgi:hypothetical protein
MRWPFGRKAKAEVDLSKLYSSLDGSPNAQGIAYAGEIIELLSQNVREKGFEEACIIYSDDGDPDKIAIHPLMVIELESLSSAELDLVKYTLKLVGKMGSPGSI